jgi:hypothetical protein
VTLGALADCSPSFTCPFYGTLFSKENKIIKKDNKGEVEKMRTLILQPPAVGRGPQESQVSIYTDMICVFTGEVLG